MAGVESEAVERPGRMHGKQPRAKPARPARTMPAANINEEVVRMATAKRDTAGRTTNNKLLRELFHYATFNKHTAQNNTTPYHTPAPNYT